MYSRWERLHHRTFEQIAVRDTLDNILLYFGGDICIIKMLPAMYSLWYLWALFIYGIKLLS